MDAPTLKRKRLSSTAPSLPIHRESTSTSNPSRIFFLPARRGGLSPGRLLRPRPNHNIASRTRSAAIPLQAVRTVSADNRSSIVLPLPPDVLPVILATSVLRRKRHYVSTPRVPDIDIADFEIHSTTRSSILFNHLTCHVEDIEWMSVKNPTCLTLPSPSQGEGQGGGIVFGGFCEGTMILHASRAGFRSSSSLAITT